jgi:glycerophosphoryl diester phosphodiesterase
MFPLESEFKVPIHNIPLKQFKKLHYAKYYSKSPRTSRSLENIFRHSQPTDSQSERESNGNGSAIQDPFATLEECFSNIPPQTGFNIEIKYPGPSTISTLGMRPFERNEFVDTILRVVFEHAKERPIIFSSFDTGNVYHNAQ